MCGWCSVHNFLRSLCVFHVCPCHGSDIMGVMHFFFPLWLIPCTLPLVLHRVEFLSVVLIACLSVRLLYFFTFHFNHFHTANYSVRICSVHRNSLEMQFCTPIPWQVVTLFIIKAKRAHIKRNVLLIQCNFFQLVFHSIHIVDAAAVPFSIIRHHDKAVHSSFRNSLDIMAEKTQRESEKKNNNNNERVLICKMQRH